jgi:NitT/TauT family transport system substrate-binding protein
MKQMTHPWRAASSAVFVGLAVVLTQGLATSADAVAAPAPELALSYAQKTVDFLPLLMAEDAGYFKKQNLDVTVRYLPAQEGIPALITDQVQGAGIGGADVVSAEAQGAKLKLVLTLTPVYPFQFWAQPKYASAIKLKGQRVAITSTTGSLYAGTLLALKALGLKTTDVSITPMGAVTSVNSALLAGSVAAAASHPPVTYKFKQAGLVDLVDLAKEHLPSVSAGLWFPDSYIKAHPDVVQAVVDAVLQTLKREKSDPTFVESEITKHLNVKDKAELDFTYDFYIKEVLTPGPMPQVDEIQDNIDAIAAKNPKVKDLDAADMIDQSFVKNAENHGTMN